LTSELIIWPEAAVTLPKHLVENYLQNWETSLVGNDQTLLLGIPIKENDDVYYNGLITIGKNSGTYLKRRLVPFGEYPFLAPVSKYIMNYLHIPMANFSAGALHQPLIELNHTKIANFICYEIAFERLVLTDFPAANLIVNISDDSWFGKSLAAWQQLQIGQFRTLETEREGLFSTNDGITAIVNARGKIISYLPRYKTTVLSGRVQPRQGKTPIMIIGSCGMLLGIGILFIGLLIFNFIHRKSKNPDYNKNN
jgi:apolipoprotein N-acyltransferase